MGDFAFAPAHGVVARSVFVATIALIAGVAFALWKRGHVRRPVAIATSLFGVMPLAYVEATWAGVVDGSALRFERPWATLLCAAVGVWVPARFRASRARWREPRRSAVEFFVSLTALAAAAAVAGPAITSAPDDRLTVFVLLDRSRSTDLVEVAGEGPAAELAKGEESMRGDDRVAVVEFGREPVTSVAPGPGGRHTQLGRRPLDRDATDIGAAIRHALAEIPIDSTARLVVVSDGVSTRGDALGAAAAAGAAGVPIDVLPIEQAPVADVRVASFRGPAAATADETIELSAVLASTSPVEADVVLRRDGEPVRREHLRLEEGETPLRWRERATTSGLHRYDVEVHVNDATRDRVDGDNAATAFVRVRGASSALVLEGDEGGSRFVVGALENAGFRTSTGGATAWPADLAGLAAHDLIVLSDVAASEVGPARVDALASYARDFGGGLLLLGGDRSLGPGGYAATPIEGVSPVRFVVRSDPHAGGLVVAMAVDSSASMGDRVGDRTKLELVNAAVASSAALLAPRDLLAIEHVDTDVSWTAPLGRVGDGRWVADAMRGARLGVGGIYVDLALDEAYGLVEGAAAATRHVVLFGDGDDAERLEGCRQKAQSAAARGVTTSVIALGAGHDVSELEALAAAGGGRFYLVDNDHTDALESVFAQDLMGASDAALREAPFRAEVAGPAVALRGIDMRAAPPLAGYVRTREKEHAEMALRGPGGDPLLATWAIGLGHVGVFTSDLKDRWGAQWVGWADATRLVGQLGRELARTLETSGVSVGVDADGGVLHVHAGAIAGDGRPDSYRRLAVRVRGPEGAPVTARLEAAGPGRYEGELAMGGRGAYLATVIDEASGRTVAETAIDARDEELPSRGTDHALLERVRGLSGGALLTSLRGVFDRRPRPHSARDPLTAALLAVAAASLTAGVAARRLSFARAAP